MSKYADVVVEEDRLNLNLARAFFQATTKVSTDIEDILPQEGGEEDDFSVFCIFAKLFPEVVGSNGHGIRNKRMRLHFNKIGYQIYGKEQSRRVPSLRAKPGNPGYGFKRARWRDTLQCPEDAAHCERILRELGCDPSKIERVKSSVQEVRWLWHKARRPSRPAGPGRPRGKTSKEDGVKEEEPFMEGSFQLSVPSGPVSTHASSPCSGHLSRSSSPPTQSSAALLETFHATTEKVMAAMQPSTAAFFPSMLAGGAPFGHLSAGKRKAEDMEETSEEKRQRLLLPCPKLPFSSALLPSLQHPANAPLALSPPLCILPPPVTSGFASVDRCSGVVLPQLRLPNLVESPRAAKPLELLAAISCGAER